ncbi:MAG: trypsin-like peptidase domain-containing protein [Limibacillus sp.]
MRASALGGALLPLALLFTVAMARPAPALDPGLLESVVSVLPDWPAEARAQALEEPEGTGFVYAEGGVIATAWHVVGVAKAIEVRLNDGRILPARLIAGDAASDIALLRVEADLTPLVLRQGYPGLGEPVCALGNAFGLDLSVTCGVVSATKRSGIGFNPLEDFIQTDAAVNPGASGGPLLDAEGRVVGLLSAIFTKQSDANIGVNFAVSAPLLERVAADLLAEGALRAVSAGLRALPSKAGGLEVAGLLPGGAAEAAGILPGDRLLYAGEGELGRPLRSPDDLRAVTILYGPAASLPLTLERGGEELQAVLELPAR